MIKSLSKCESHINYKQIHKSYQNHILIKTLSQYSKFNKDEKIHIDIKRTFSIQLQFDLVLILNHYLNH